MGQASCGAGGLVISKRQQSEHQASSSGLFPPLCPTHVEISLVWEQQDGGQWGRQKPLPSETMSPVTWCPSILAEPSSLFLSSDLLQWAPGHAAADQGSTT